MGSYRLIGILYFKPLDTLSKKY